MTSFKLINPTIIISEWFPMGRNNLLSLNRHLGSHKKYNSVTEFGMKGLVENLNDACYKLLDNGCYLKPESFRFSGFLKAKFKLDFEDENEKGLEVNNDGHCSLGFRLDSEISIQNAKEIIRNSEKQFNNKFVELLSESQQNLLKAAYGKKSLEKIADAVPSYSLVLLNEFDLPIQDSASFLKEYNNVFAPTTDWIINHFTFKDNHVFIGIKAMVCIGGKQDEAFNELLKNILFQKTSFVMSLQLFSNLWAIDKKIINFRKLINESNFTELKKYNLELGELNNTLSQQTILNEILINAIENKSKEWDVLLDANKEFQNLDTGEGLLEEFEKAENRNLLIKQLKIDIDNAQTLLQNRISMMMTKNGQKLNLTLLLLTLISVVGISEVIGLSFWKAVLVVIALTPFVIFTVQAFLSYYKNFLPQSKKSKNVV